MNILLKFKLLEYLVMLLMPEFLDDFQRNDQAILGLTSSMKSDEEMKSVGEWLQTILQYNQFSRMAHPIESLLYLVLRVINSVNKLNIYTIWLLWKLVCGATARNKNSLHGLWWSRLGVECKTTNVTVIVVYVSTSEATAWFLKLWYVNSDPPKEDIGSEVRK